MAVTPAVPLLKSQPDMSKLNAFTGYMVSVTKHLGPKGTPGTAVVPTQKMDKDKLLALQVHLPLQYGAGYYQFTVTDEGGTGSDEWMVKLGTDVTPTQEGLPMGQQPPYMQPPVAPGTPLDPGVTQIMPGWFYNEAANLLMAPWKKTYSWKMGDPMPDPPPTGSHLSLVPPNATPWSWPQQQQPWASGWGGYPATETKSSELDVIKQQLAEEREARKDAERRNEERAREDRMREEMRQQREATEKRFEQILATIATNAKPTGPSEAEQRLQREIEETRRRTEEAERRAADERKEAQRREEQRAAEERHREEMRMMEKRIEAATANKTDPMMTLFGTILQTQTANSQETARMIRETSQAAQAASERSTAQIVELARASREGAMESSKSVLEGMKGLMDTSTQFYQQMLDVAGSGSQPWYAGVLQEGVGKIGLLGQALMERNQAAAAPAQYMPPQRIVQGRPMAPGARPMPGQPVPQRMAPPPVDPNTRPADADYNQETEEFVFPDGWRVKQALVQQVGWAAVLKKRPPVPVAAAPASPASPASPAPMPVAAAPAMNGTNGAVPDAVIPPPAVAKPAKGGKKKRAAARARAPEPEPEVAESVEVPPPANGVGYTSDELREMEPDQIAEILQPLADEGLFGQLMPYVTDLRKRAASGLPAAKAAEFILGTRAYARSFGASPPPAFELLATGHLEVLVERLLPEAPEAYQDAVIDIMEKQLAAENPQSAEMVEQ